MALMNLIEFVDETGAEMAHRVPEQGRVSSSWARS